MPETKLEEACATVVRVLYVEATPLRYDLYHGRFYLAEALTPEVYGVHASRISVHGGDFYSSLAGRPVRFLLHKTLYGGIGPRVN